MKLVFDPRKDFAAAPQLVRVLYITLVAMGVTYLASTISAAVEGNFFGLIAGVLVAYLVADSGFAVLRGRTVGMFMTRLFSILSIAGAVLAGTVVIDSGLTATNALSIATGALGLVVLGMSFLPAVKGFVKVNIASRQVIAEEATKRRNIEAQQKVSEGSWADISRKQD